MLLCCEQATKKLVAWSRGPLSLREATSCDRQFILNHGRSLRVVEVPETSEKPTQSFRIHYYTLSHTLLYSLTYTTILSHIHYFSSLTYSTIVRVDNGSTSMQRNRVYSMNSEMEIVTRAVIGPLTKSQNTGLFLRRNF